MKQKLYLLCAAVCLVSCTACGRGEEPGARYPETTVTATRTAVRTAERHTTRRATTRVGEDARNMAEDAARGASELASDAAAKGRELMTDIAADASDAVAERAGDGAYHADEDGSVTETAVR